MGEGGEEKRLGIISSHKMPGWIRPVCFHHKMMCDVTSKPIVSRVIGRDVCTLTTVIPNA